MDTDEEDARAFAIARDLIVQHGDDVALFLQKKLDDLTACSDFEQLSAWFLIRNAVAILLVSSHTLH